MSTNTTIKHKSGLEVHVYRSKIDGELVVDIDSSKLEGSDNIGIHSEPKIRIMVNEARVFDHGEAVAEEDYARHE